MDYSNYIQESNSNNLLSRISKLAKDHQSLILELEQKQIELDKIATKITYIEEKVLPTLMEEADQSEIKTKDGLKVEIKESLKGSISNNNKSKAYEWLEKHGHSDLIKNQFIIEFNRQDHEWAKDFEEDLSNLDNIPIYEKKHTIHNGTLNSFIKKEVEKGVEIPVDLFNLHRITKAVIKK